MSVTLNTEGTITVSKSTYTEPKCALANWLQSSARLGRPTIYSDGAAAKVTLAAKRGVIFFKDCFTRDGSTVQTGDHIDLWQNGFTKTYDDPNNKAKQVWFWEFP
jgi:Type VI secretion system (T6SS), amidase effector protein 4